MTLGIRASVLVLMSAVAKSLYGRECDWSELKQAPSVVGAASLWGRSYGKMSSSLVGNLDAHFLRCEPGKGEFYVGSIEEAHGVSFDCPRCPDGHMIVCWFEGCVVDTRRPGPGRWKPSGTSLTNLTLHPSVNNLGCGWHGWVRDGRAG